MDEEIKESPVIESFDKQIMRVSDIIAFDDACSGCNIFLFQNEECAVVYNVVQIIGQLQSMIGYN
jgi:hypothetical protein